MHAVANKRCGWWPGNKVLIKHWPDQASCICIFACIYALSSTVSPYPITFRLPHLILLG